MSPRTNRMDAITAIASTRLRELREQGVSHEEIATRFGLPRARILQLCHDLLGEEEGAEWSWTSPEVAA